MVFKRKGYERIISDVALDRISKDCCPACGKSRDCWDSIRKNHFEWKCCCSACTSRYYRDFVTINDWSVVKKEAFKRDNYTCNGCNCKESKDLGIEGDHIVPVAVGGPEFDLDNIQTLCIPCHKIKTKKDHKIISAYRKREKELLKGGTFLDDWIKISKHC